MALRLLPAAREAGESAARISIPAIVAVEIGVTGVLTLALFVRSNGLPAVWGLPAMAVALVCTASLGIMAVTASVLAGYISRPDRERRRTQERDRWANTWINVVFGDATPPADPIDPNGIHALLELRESLIGEPAEKVDSLMRDHGMSAEIVRQLEQESPRRHHLTTASLGRRVNLLDDLGRARSPEAVGVLLRRSAEESEPTARQMGIRALARSVAAITNRDERAAVAPEVLRVLQEANLSPGALGEAMSLFGPSAEQIVGLILGEPRSFDEKMIVAALEEAGRTVMTAYSAEIVSCTSSSRTRVRAAALHALSKFPTLPAAAGPIVQKAFEDREPAIRIEAARLGQHLDPKTAILYLEDLLCDKDWSVRRTAATTLASLGGPGIRTLIATSLVHGDQRARRIATQVLVESRTEAELGQEPEKVG